MSWGHIHAAFNYKGEVGETALHLLLRIAFEIRENDYSYPGTAYLADRMHVSRKTVQRALNELRAAGVLDIRSGRLSGHKNHYYLTLPDTPQGGTKTTLSTTPPVDNSPQGVGQKRPEHENEGRICPTPLGQKRPEVGQIRPEGWDKNDPGKGNRIRKEDTDRQNQPAQNVPPPSAAVHNLPPVGTVEFKAQAIHFAMMAGASLAEARRFYEHHQSENWTVLDKMPLEVAAEYWVKSWKERDPKSYLTEQLSRLKTRENEGF